MSHCIEPNPHHVQGRQKVIVLLISFIWLFLLFGCSERPNPPLVENGFLDLSSWNFEQNGIAHLDGQWTIYRQKLLSPEDISGPKPPVADGTIAVPGFQHGKETIGFWTFTLTLRFSQMPSGLALQIGDVNSAYRLWINGELAAEVGKVGMSEKQEVPQSRLTIIPLKAGSPKIDLVLQISNYFNTRSCIADSIWIGLESHIRTQARKSMGIAILVCGCLLMMGLYQLLLYLIRTKERSSLYFGLFCLETGIWYLVSNTSGRFLTVLLPDLSMLTLYRIDLLSFYLAVPTLMMFIHSCFPEESSKRVERIVLALAFPCWLTVVFAPAQVFFQTVLPYMILALLCVVYALVIIAKAIYHKREGSVYFLAGIAVFGITAVNDVLYANRLIQTAYLFPVGVLAVVVSNSFLLALRFFKAFTAVEVMSRDLDEKNIALLRMDKMKDEFLASTSHELKTPLNGMIGLAESLRDGAFGRLSQSAAGNLGLIADSGRRLAGLINDILDFSRLKNQDLTLDTAPVDIRVLVNTVLAMSGPAASAKQLELKNEIPENAPCVLADESRLFQILYNLVGNAVKFTRKGRVRITAAQTGDMLEIQVIDTGIGIAPGDLERIFNAFEQISPSDAGAVGGIGLGLAITRHLVTLHEGEIRAESEPGKGARFCLTLPVSRETAQKRTALEMSGILQPESSDMPMPETQFAFAKGRAKTARHVLVVDDDPVNLRVLASQLAFLDNIEVNTLDNGPATLAFIKKRGCPDLILLDIMMPGMNGYEVCRTLREDFAPSVLPVMLITAKNRVVDLVEGFACGANDYIAKPFSKDELLARVTTQLELKKAYGVLKENIRLKKEVERRKLTELDLKLTQQRLSRILDSIDEAVIAVNESREICFSNSPCQRMLGYEPDELLGRPVALLGTALDSHGGFGGDHPAGDAGKKAGVAAKDGKRVPCRISMASLEMDHETLQILILEKEYPAEKWDQTAALSFIRELNVNRQRIQILEDTLLANGLNVQGVAVAPGLTQVRTTLEKMETLVEAMPADLEKKREGHRVMTLSLALWKKETGLTKIELAEQSGVWKVYMNGNGFERTQTLDKYLDINTFPKQPRWRNIFDTAEFVLAACTTESNPRTELEISFAGLKTLH